MVGWWAALAAGADPDPSDGGLRPPGRGAPEGLDPSTSPPPDPVEALARRISLTGWGIEEGLPQSSVTGLVQTADGYLLLGTFGGLARFDGLTFRTVPRGPLSIRYTAVATAPDGRVYVGTQLGEVAELVGDTLVPIATEGAFGLVRDLLPRDHDLWVGTDSGLWRLAGGTWTAFPLPVYELAARGDEVWAVGPDGFGWVDAGGLHREPLGPVDAGTSGLAVHRDDLWIATTAGVVVRTADGQRLVAVPPAGEEWREARIRVDHEARVWLGERHGLELLGTADALLDAGRSGRPVRRDTVVGVPGGVRELELDREGHLWLGTDGYGLHRAAIDPFERHVVAGDGPGPQPIRLVETTGANPVLAPACGGGLVELAGDRQRQLLAGECVRSLVRTTDGALLAALDRGRQTEIVRVGGPRVAVVPSDVLALAESPAGGLWIGTSTGAGRLVEGALEPLAGVEGAVDVIVVDRSGAVWFGLPDGVAIRRTGAALERIGPAEGLPHAQVRAILVDDDGVAWLGTYGGGLVRLEDGRPATVFTRHEGLPDDVVSAILDDGRGNLWLNGNRGTARVPRRDLDAVAQRRQSTVRAQLFSTGEGNGGATPAGGIDARGGLWFPTIASAVRLDPGELHPSADPPRVVIEQVTIGDQDFPPDAGLQTPRVGQRDLTVRYAAAVLGSPLLARFRYKLQPVDAEWRNAEGNRVVRYPRLHAGTYTFLVSAANEEGGWSEPTTFTFDLPPFLSERLTFRAVGLLAGLAVLLGVLQLWVRNQADRAGQLQVEVDRRSKVEEELRTSEGKYRSVFEGASDGLLITDGDGYVVDANPAAEGLFGTELRRARGRRRDDLVRQDTGGGDVGVRPDGTTFSARVTTAPLGPGRTLTSVVDLTPLLDLQERLAAAHRLEAVGRLAGGVAHDFNNLLTVARESTGSLRQQLQAASSDPAIAESLDQIELVVRRSTDLTRQLLAFGRRQMLQGEPFDVGDLVLRIRPMLARLTASSDALTVRVAADQRAVVVADPALMELAVVNLVVNALEAKGPEGGARVAVEVHVSTGAEARAQWPDVREGPDAWVVVSVTDDGLGIPAELLPHVFEPFFTTKRSSGSGLGLASVHGFVTQSNGYVTVSSMVGKGSRFDVLLPQAPPEFAPTPAPAPDADGAGNIGHVLVCDDDPLVRRTLERLLKHAGHKVKAADGAESALKILREGGIDVLVTDVQMPHITGVELARAARRFQPGLGVVFVSGYTRDLDEALGAPLVSKPFDPAVLVAAVRRALKGVGR